MPIGLKYLKIIAFIFSELQKSFNNVSVKTSYAPIAIVSGIDKDTPSFVELDYFKKNCINILTKGDGIGLIGGITLEKIEKCDEYLDFVIKKHMELNPNMQVIEKYIGKKNEIIFKNEDRNYLFHGLAFMNLKSFFDKELSEHEEVYLPILVNGVLVESLLYAFQVFHAMIPFFAQFLEY